MKKFRHHFGFPASSLLAPWFTLAVDGADTGEFVDRSGLHNFDFIFGSWKVHHRRLKERLSGCTEWVEFSGNCRVQPILAGAANVDDNWLELPDGHYRAASIRSFDAGRSQWSIWWLDGRHPGELDPPVVGRFSHGVGEFYAEMLFQGKPIRVRFRWTQTTTATPRWDQAFSPDGGQSWETNWTMDFTSIAQEVFDPTPNLEK